MFWTETVINLSIYRIRAAFLSLRWIFKQCHHSRSLTFLFSPYKKHLLFSADESAILRLLFMRLRLEKYCITLLLSSSRAERFFVIHFPNKGPPGWNYIWVNTKRRPGRGAISTNTRLTRHKTVKFYGFTVLMVSEM